MRDHASAQREMNVLMAKYVGKPLTPELKKEIEEKAYDVLFVNKINDVEIYWAGGKMSFKFKESMFNKTAMILSFIMGPLVIFSIIVKPLYALVFGIFLLCIVLLRFSASRDLEKIHAEQLGLTLKEYRELNK